LSSGRPWNSQLEQAVAQLPNKVDVLTVQASMLEEEVALYSSLSGGVEVTSPP
jgi:hypothetical protein